jgi:uncharacterized membrane protein YedE/YeeE
MSAPFFTAGTTADLVAAIGIGILFGVTLERSGLGNARKLMGQFDLTDLTVFKVMFSAIVTAMLGAFLLSRAGVLDLSRVYIPETWLLPQLVGGVVFGAGFATAGLCPGTSCVAAATGRVDGLAVIFGMLVGVFGTAAAMPIIGDFFRSTARGGITLPTVLGASENIVIFVMTMLALVGFAAAERIEARRI